jgi:Zn-dependent peptidase ImmA (M78 family)
MVSKIRRLEVAKCAEDLIKRLGIGSLPVDPIKIATDHEITVQSWRPTKKGVSGFLMKNGEAFGLSYSEFIANQGFINFTVGHELGHYFPPGHVERLFANGSGIHYSHSGFVSHDDCEREADLFSATLLMPEVLFRQAIRTAGEGFLAIETLSRLCMTSVTASAIRFAEFADSPVAVIVSSEGRVAFASLSDAMRESGFTWPKAGDLVPQSSTTYSFQKDADNITKGRKAEAFAMLDEWFDGAPRVEVKEDVVGLGDYGKTLTVLFTSEALESDEDESEEDGYIPSWRR